MDARCTQKYSDDSVYYTDSDSVFNTTGGAPGLIDRRNVYFRIFRYIIPRPSVIAWVGGPSFKMFQQNQ